ncbi:MAG: GTP pyrophosphokinase family protein [Treponema sp.]|jgi:putative GTP pyrophosphokinase|nr:GTP pyrophosphokinase family protein [Treponema sp.]
MDFSLDYFKKQVERLEDNFLGKFHKRIEPIQKFMSYYKCALMEIETKFKVLDEEFSFLHERNPIDNIKTRIKDFESIRKKLRRKKISPSINSIEQNIHDIAGIRIICPFIDDIYMLADCLAAQDDIKVLERKDYIANPKENGYRSLHLIVEIPIFLHNEKRLVKVEVQLRTIAMEFWANLEHRLHYKKEMDEKISKELSVELTDCAEVIANLDIKMKNIHDRIENKSTQNVQMKKN